MNSAAEARPISRPLLGIAFDRTFVFLPAALGLTALLAVMIEPALFVPILLADLWILGYHHVIATFLRLGLDAQTRATHALLWLLLPAMLLMVGLLAWSAGIWIIDPPP